MASFQVKRKDTGIIYNIKVGEFLVRDNFTSNSDGGVELLKPNGFTEITVSGDNIIDKLGLDALKQGAEFYFTNNPDYYLRLENPNGNSQPVEYTRQIDSSMIPSDQPETTIETCTVKYTSYSLSIYKNGGIITRLFPFAEFTNIEPLDNTVRMIYGNISPYPMYKPRIAFSFSQKLVCVLSPYYFNYPTYYFGSDRTIASTGTRAPYFINPTYIGQSFYLPNLPKIAGNGDYGLHIYGTDNNFLYKSDTQRLTYGELSNKSVLDTVSHNLPVGNYTTNVNPSYNMQLNTNSYELLFSLLFDTDSDDNPYPDNPDNKDPSGQSKPNTGGNGNNPSGGNPSSDIISNPNVPSVNPISTGSVNLYQMDVNTFKSFMSYLWSNPFYTTIIKLFQDPMQAVISAHIIGVAVPVAGKEYITIGNVTTDIPANIVGNNFVRVSFYYIEIPEFYGDASDYLETIVELYLPYHGYVTLNTFEVIGAKVYLDYTIDVLTGSFVAVVTVSKTIEDTTLNSVLYQYNGNMAYQIPLSSVDYSSYITASLGAIGALTQKRIGSIVGGLVDSALSIDIGYDRASTLTANTGYMSVKEAYVTILRPIHAQAPNFAHYVGYPYEGYVTLGSCSGLTICREVYINNVLGTEEETKEIRSLLMEGVIF